MLKVEMISAGYGPILAIEDISFNVDAGQILTIIGANGAGKSTLLRTISGLVSIQSGRVWYRDQELTHKPVHQIVACGVAHVPEGRRIFASLSVEENLRLGAFLQTDTIKITEIEAEVYALFPKLYERRSQMGGTLSGGEQQMLAIGRALMGIPSLLMLDEPSLGIAPILVEGIFEKIQEIRRRLNMAIVLVEQNANLALQIADQAVVLETGHMTLFGPASDLRQNDMVRRAYLGQ